MNISKTLCKIVSSLVLVSFLSTSNVYGLRPAMQGFKKVEELLSEQQEGPEFQASDTEPATPGRQSYESGKIPEDEGNLKAIKEGQDVGKAVELLADQISKTMFEYKEGFFVISSKGGIHLCPFRLGGLGLLDIRRNYSY